jgi:GT2 family glycosyltransferase
MKANTTATIIVNYQTPWHLNLCLDSLFKEEGDFHVFLVHNAPDSKSLKVGEKYLKKYPERITIQVNRENLGLTEGVHSVFEQVKDYDLLWLLNSDVIIQKGTFNAMSRILGEHPDVMQVSADTNSHYPEKLWWLAATKVPRVYKYRSVINPPHSPEKCKFGYSENPLDFAGGFCNLSRMEPLRERGYILDTKIAHGYWDDFEMTFYLRKFGKIARTDEAYVFHFLNASFHKLDVFKNSNRHYLKFWNGMYVIDKYSQELRKLFNKMDSEQHKGLVEFPVYVIAMRYFGMIDVSPDMKEIIKALPAQQIWKEMKK